MKYQKIGPYTLLQKIAAGGMADIFLAKKSGPNNLNSFYAIKKILEKYAEMPQFHKMFHKEAKITTALSLDIHKNVMTSAIYEKIGNHYIFVMEYIKGLNLKHFLKLAEKKNSPLGVEAILYITAEIASGLDHLHNLVNLKTGQPLNLVHRDISPQNIMISHNGQIKIIDFGIAKASILEETQADSGIKGKMAYMSPEQIMGNNLDGRSDIFSLGIMLWELLAKKRLFLADSSMETLRNVRNCQVPDIKLFNPNISSQIEQILKKSLAKNKKERYKHATDFAQDLYKAIQEKENFSSYNFEKLSKKIYTDDIIKSRRLLAKYMNMSTDKDYSTVDITHLGVDFDKVDKEETKDLSILTDIKINNPTTNTLINASKKSSAVNKPSAVNKLSAAKISKEHLDFTVDASVQKIIKHNQKYLAANKNNISNVKVANKSNVKTVSRGNPSNVHARYQRPQTFKRKTKSSPFFAIIFSASLAVAAFFLFSSANHQDTLIQKIVQLKTDSAKYFGVQNIKKTINTSSPATLNSVKIKESDNAALTSLTLLTYFHTSPAGVEIFINNRSAGVSPDNIELPKNQIITITLKKYKYHTERFKINTKLLAEKRRGLAAINSKVTINKQEIRITLKKLSGYNKDTVIK